MSGHERNWTTVGEDVVGRVGGRPAVEAEIERLDWQDVPEGGSLTLGFMPGEAINATIRDLNLPKVSAVAVSSFSCPAADADEDGFYPGFYGIECHYSNGRARVYVFDTGTAVLPACSDHWPEGGEEAVGPAPRPTYRERREARVERLQGWGASRAAASDAAHARVHAIADQIPFGQPILVGHHSEGRARADQRRMHDGMRASVENAAMAEQHLSRAANIESQLRTSIYDDDPDAIERLEAKLAALEAQREERKEANAAYRREHRAELKAMTPYERSQAIPFPSYSLSNLGGTISRTRDRLARLRKERENPVVGRGHGRQMASRYGGTCPDCDGPIERGTLIVWFRSTKEAVHASCVADAAAEARAGALLAGGAED